jgi:ligand-binding sensor domain-containing protein
MSRSIVFVLLFFGYRGASTAAAQSLDWTLVGGPPFGVAAELATAPSDPEIVYLGTTDGRLFRSGDGGQSWTGASVDSLRPVIDIVVDPDDSEVVFVALGWARGANDEHASLRSDDGGQTWQPVAEDRHVLAVAPSAPRILYSESARSDDGGLTWVVGDWPGRFADITIDPRDPNRVFAFVSTRRLYRSDDGGLSWVLVLDAPMLDLALDPGAPDIIIASTRLGFQRSEDGGETWEQPSLDPGGEVSRSDSVFYFLSDQLRLSPGSHGDIYVYGSYIGYGGRQGLLHSEDNGDTWLRIGDALQDEFQGFQQIEKLVMPAPGTLLVSTDRGEVYRSADGGGSWQRTGAHISRPALTQLVTGKTAEGETWYGANEHGLFRSEDRGDSWTRILLTQAWTYTDPIAGERVYARYQLGRSSAWRLLHSSDAGRNWANAGLENLEISALAVVPGSPGRAFAAGTHQDYGSNLYRTDDNGQSWDPIDIDPGGWSAQRIFINPHEPEQLFADIGPPGKDDSRLTYRSDDGGHTWEPTSLEFERPPVMAWSPSDPSIAYAGILKRENVSGLEGPSYFNRSFDSGLTWEQIESFCCARMTGLAVHPEESRLLFAFKWMSRDGGRTWDSLMPKEWDQPIVSFFIDSRDSQRLYAATERGLFTARFSQLPAPLPDPSEPSGSHATAPALGNWSSVFTDGPVYALVAAEDGEVWFTSRSLWRTDGGTVRLVTPTVSTGQDTDLDIDALGRPWVSTEVSRLTDGDWTSVVPELVERLVDAGETFSIDAVLAEDGNGHNWIGVSSYHGFVGGGLYQIENGVPTLVSIGYGNELQINVIVLAPDGVLWIGMGGWVYAQSEPWGGLAAFDGQTWRYYGLREGLTHPHVNDIAFGPGGAVWVGTEGGLTRFEDGGQHGRSFTTTTSALVGDHITALAVDPMGTVWIGTTAGLSRLAGNLWSTYRASDTSLGGDRIHDLLVDKQNRVWVATDGGLSILDTDGATAVIAESATSLPEAVSLHANFPNPFNGRTAIHFELPATVDARLAVYDMLGRHVRALVSGITPRGEHRVLWDGRDDRGHTVSSGVYFLILRANEIELHRQVMLLK